MATTALIEKIRQDIAASRLQLPSLPEVISQIQLAMDDENKGLMYIARLIQAEPTLSARLIKIANSPLYHSGVEMQDIRRVVSRLGLEVTRNLVSCLIMHNIFNVKSAHLHRRMKELWKHSCRVAAISQVLARVTYGLNPGRALLAGLLHDIGVLPVLVYADQFPSITDDMSKLDEVISSLRGELGQQILEQWHMGEDMQMVPLAAESWHREHEGGADLGDIVQVAQVHSYFGREEGRVIPPLTELPAFRKLSISKMGPHAGLELLEQAKTEINLTMRLLSG